MKRVVVLVLGLVLLAGCGAVVDTAVSPSSVHQTIPDAPTSNTAAAVPAPTNAEGEERFQLYAELPEEDIYLYEVRGRNPQAGMVLFQGNSANYFNDWEAARRFNDLTEIAYRDFDGDGEREIGVITGSIAGGQGPSVRSLHILKVHEDTPYPNKEIKTIRYTEYAFTHNDATDYFKQRMTWKRGKQPHTLELKIDGKTFLAHLHPLAWDEAKGVEVNLKIYFDFNDDGSISFSGAVRTYYEEYPRYLGTFTADVIFDGRQINLTNFNFEPEN